MRLVEGWEFGMEGAREVKRGVAFARAYDVWYPFLGMMECKYMIRPRSWFGYYYTTSLAATDASSLVWKGKT